MTAAIPTIRPIVLHGDLPVSDADALLDSGTIAWDIETSGLDWRKDRIGSCQICSKERRVFIVRMTETPPAQLARVLASPQVCKVFHHAMFDLRFMRSHWGVLPANVACTKISAVLLDRGNVYSHSLQAVLDRYLGVSIDKVERTSNWFRETLTDAQIKYAADDVAYLIPALSQLEIYLRKDNLYHLAMACFQHLPIRVELEFLGYGDVFSYSP